VRAKSDPVAPPPTSRFAVRNLGGGALSKRPVWARRQAAAWSPLGSGWCTLCVAIPCHDPAPARQKRWTVGLAIQGHCLNQGTPSGRGRHRPVGGARRIAPASSRDGVTLNEIQV